MAISPTVINELIRRARDDHDSRAREALLGAFAPLVKSVAVKFTGSGETFEDLVQEGNLGLLSAMDLFKADQNIQFSTYAHHLIAGQIRHYLRDRGTLIRQPAWIQEERTRLEKTRSTFHETMGREPTAEELAEKSELSESRLQEILSTQRMSHVLRFDIGTPEDGSDAIDEERLQETAPEPSLSTEERLVLRDALAQLKPLERRVIEDIYYNDLTQTEIARRLGVSSNYVSRILKSSSRRLKEALGDKEKTRAGRRLEQKLAAPDPTELVDEATGLYSPTYFRDRVEEEIQRARRYEHPLAVARVSVMGIPEVGRADSISRALRATARILRESVRRVDIVARLDKREFGVLLPYTGQRASIAADRIVTALAANDEGLPLRGVYGFSWYPQDAVTAQGLLALAEPPPQ